MGEQAAARPLSLTSTGQAGAKSTTTPRRRQVKRRRVLIADARADGRYLRVTWHAEDRMFVLSTWSDEVCSGAVRIPVTNAPELINLLSDGLGDAARAQPATPKSAAKAQVDDIKDQLSRFTTWLRGFARS